MDTKRMIYEYVIADSQGQNAQISLVIVLTNVTDVLVLNPITA